MKCTQLLILVSILFLLCSCAMFYDRQSGPPHAVAAPRPLVLPLGKNWQVIEEAPKLSDGGRPPFQTEQSLQPEGGKHVEPGDNRTIGLPR